MFAFVAAGKETRSTDPARGRRYERILKSNTNFGEGVDVGSLHDRVACTTKRVITLIVGEQKQDVGGT